MLAATQFEIGKLYRWGESGHYAIWLIDDLSQWNKRHQITVEKSNIQAGKPTTMVPGESFIVVDSFHDIDGIVDDIDEGYQSKVKAGGKYLYLKVLAGMKLGWIRTWDINFDIRENTLFEPLDFSEKEEDHG